MRLAYLTNRYIHPRGGFVWDEIRALEARGVRVKPFAVHPAERPRRYAGSGHDAVHVIRDRHVLGLLRLVLATMWSRPVLFLGALRAAMELARRAERRSWGNLMRLAEAC